MDDDGQVLFESLVKPSQPIPHSATRIHGIHDEDVQSARTWPVIWPQVRSVLFGRLVVIYNEEFDLRMMQQSHARYRLPWKDKFNTFDLLKLYAEFRGEWDSQRALATATTRWRTPGSIAGFTFPMRTAPPPTPC